MFGLFSARLCVHGRQESHAFTTNLRYGRAGPRILVDCPLDPLSLTAFPVHRSGSVLDEASHGSTSASGHATFIQTAELGLVDPATVDCVLLTNFHNMQALREDPKIHTQHPFPSDSDATRCHSVCVISDCNSLGWLEPHKQASMAEQIHASPASQQKNTETNFSKQQAAFFTEGEIPFSGVVLATEPTAQLGASYACSKKITPTKTRHNKQCVQYEDQTRSLSICAMH
jgi:hypothetical protein